MDRGALAACFPVPVTALSLLLTADCQLLPWPTSLGVPVQPSPYLCYSNDRITTLTVTTARRRQSPVSQLGGAPSGEIEI